MDNDEEYTTSNPRSASILSSAQMNFARGSFNSSKKFYKSQNKCSICDKSFSKSPESLLKRYCCQFCYNAACSSCSSLTYLNILTNNHERCCITCFVSFTKEECEKQAESKYRKTLEDETEIRLSESNLRKTIEIKYKQLEDQQTEKDSEKNEVLVNMSDELVKVRIELEELRMEKNKIEADWKEVKKVNEDFNEEYIRLNNEVVNVRSELEAEQRKKVEIEKKWRDDKKISENACEEVSRLKAENEELRKKVQGLMRDTKASSCGCCIV